MTDERPPAFGWICTACGRRVPKNVLACRCGFRFDGTARPADLTLPTPSVAPASEPRAPGALGILAAGAAAALVLVGAFYWTKLHKSAPDHPAVVEVRSAHDTATADAAPEQATPPASLVAPEVDAAPLTNDALPTTGSSPDRAEPEPPPALPTDAISLEDLVGRVLPAVVTIQTPSGRGSGFFVAPDIILTNVHVVTTSRTVTVRRSDGTTTTARVEKQSDAFDIAVLRVLNPVADQATIPMGSAVSARAGQEVIAIGTPLGFLQNTVTRGIVSGLRQVDGATLVQTDASINPGNSGGPLLDRKGAAIGIIKSGYEGRGLSFAVAIEHARALLGGQAAPAAVSAPGSEEYRALSPAVASPGEQRRLEGLKAYEQTIAELARRADALDSQWRSFQGACYAGRITGSFDRVWFALFEPRAMQGTVAPGCGAAFVDLRREAQDIRDGVVGADERARQADVYPGARRDVLRRGKLDYQGWNK
jgi:S1-C subfamily serine protease